MYSMRIGCTYIYIYVVIVDPTTAHFAHQRISFPSQNEFSIGKLMQTVPQSSLIREEHTCIRPHVKTLSYTHIHSTRSPSAQINNDDDDVEDEWINWEKKCGKLHGLAWALENDVTRNCSRPHIIFGQRKSLNRIMCVSIFLLFFFVFVCASHVSAVFIHLGIHPGGRCHHCSSRISSNSYQVANRVQCHAFIHSYSLTISLSMARIAKD